jgi:hypothetical protein
MRTRPYPTIPYSSVRQQAYGLLRVRFGYILYAFVGYLLDAGSDRHYRFIARLESNHKY